MFKVWLRTCFTGTCPPATSCRGRAASWAVSFRQLRGTHHLVPGISDKALGGWLDGASCVSSALNLASNALERNWIPGTTSIRIKGCVHSPILLILPNLLLLVQCWAPHLRCASDNISTLQIPSKHGTCTTNICLLTSPSLIRQEPGRLSPCLFPGCCLIYGPLSVHVSTEREQTLNTLSLSTFHSL